MIWREPIKVEYENTFALQDIVSEKVINRLKLQFSQDERVRMQSNVSQDPWPMNIICAAFPTHQRHRATCWGLIC